LELLAQELSYAQIGARLGIKENAVAQLLLRARRRLRREFRLAQVDSAKLPDQCKSYLPVLVDYLETRFDATQKGQELALVSYLEGKLNKPQRQQTIDHVLACVHCQSNLMAMGEDAEKRARAVILPLFGLHEAQTKNTPYQKTSASSPLRTPSTDQRQLPSASLARRPALAKTLATIALIVIVGSGATGLVTHGANNEQTVEKAAPAAKTNARPFSMPTNGSAVTVVPPQQNVNPVVPPQQNVNPVVPPQQNAKLGQPVQNNSGAGGSRSGQGAQNGSGFGKVPPGQVVQSSRVPARTHNPG
jgi:anti-sigma factor RsiW